MGLFSTYLKPFENDIKTYISTRLFLTEDRNYNTWVYISKSYTPQILFERLKMFPEEEIEKFKNYLSRNMTYKGTSKLSLQKFVYDKSKLLSFYSKNIYLFTQKSCIKSSIKKENCTPNYYRINCKKDN